MMSHRSRRDRGHHDLRPGRRGELRPDEERRARPGPSGWPSTTSCSGSRRSWATPRPMRAGARSRARRLAGNDPAADARSSRRQPARQRPAPVHQPGRGAGRRRLRHRAEPGLPGPGVPRPAPPDRPAPGPAGRRSRPSCGSSGPSDRRLSSPAYVEQQARDRLHMCLPAQTCYVIIGGTKRTARAAAGHEVVTPWYGAAVVVGARRPTRPPADDPDDRCRQR